MKLIYLKDGGDALEDKDKQYILGVIAYAADNLDRIMHKLDGKYGDTHPCSIELEGIVDDLMRIEKRVININ